MSNQITIESLQVGQQVVIGHRHGAYTAETITKINKTQIVTDSGKRFSKKSGDVVGGTSFSTQHWLARTTGCWWQLMSVEKMNEINAMDAMEQKLRETRNLIKSAINDGRLGSLSAADLQTVANLLGLE